MQGVVHALCERGCTGGPIIEVWRGLRSWSDEVSLSSLPGRRGTGMGAIWQCDGRLEAATVLPRGFPGNTRCHAHHTGPLAEVESAVGFVRSRQEWNEEEPSRQARGRSLLPLGRNL